jgi:hypothetical protein
LEQWYSNKDLYEMMVDLSKRLEKTNAELSKTQVLIRDYNGLREKLNDIEDRVVAIEGQQKGSKDMWGYVIGAIGAILTIINFATK